MGHALTCLLWAAGSFASGEQLLPRSIREGLPVMVRVDAFGLGRETSELQAWLSGDTAPDIEQNAAGIWTVLAGSRQRVVTPALGSALHELNQFVALEDASKVEPVPAEDVQTALTSPEGVEAVERLFD